MTLNYAYASSDSTDPAVSVDLPRTTEWQTHYAVNGFVNTGPADPYQIFKIHYRVINGTVEQFRMPYSGYAHQISADVSADGNGTLEVKFPKNYPIYEGGATSDFIAFFNEIEIFPENTEDDCFVHLRTPFSGNGTLDILQTTIFSEPFEGLEVSDDCLPETITQDVVKKDGIITPLHQMQAGVIPEEVVCGDDMTLVMNTKGKPYCATPNSAEILNERWNNQ